MDLFDLGRAVGIGAIGSGTCFLSPRNRHLFIRFKRAEGVRFFLTEGAIDFAALVAGDLPVVHQDVNLGGSFLAYSRAVAIPSPDFAIVEPGLPNDSRTVPGGTLVLAGDRMLVVIWFEGDLYTVDLRSGEVSPEPGGDRIRFSKWQIAVEAQGGWHSLMTFDLAPGTGP